MADRGPDPNEVQNAKELCVDLLNNVKEQYEAFKANPPAQHSSYGGYGNSSGGYQQRMPDRQQSYGGYSSSYGGQQSPVAQIAASPASQGAPGAGSPTDYSAQYAQYYGAGQVSLHLNPNINRTV